MAQHFSKMNSKCQFIKSGNFLQILANFKILLIIFVKFYQPPHYLFFSRNSGENHILLSWRPFSRFA